MNVQGFQKVTLLDFPGRVACTVFCGGCNLRCPFCHNASLVQAPQENPNGQEEVLGYLAGRVGILDGVCITGGEPMLQSDLGEFIAKVKAMGLAVKLDTNGAFPSRLASLLQTGLVDYVAMDLKSSPEGYPRAVGIETSFEPFAESMRILRESGCEYEFRTTAVKGIHTAQDFDAIASLLQEKDRFFLQQFRDSGNLLGTGVSAFSHEEMCEHVARIRRLHPAACLRGVEE